MKETEKKKKKKKRSYERKVPILFFFSPRPILCIPRCTLAILTSVRFYCGTRDKKTSSHQLRAERRSSNCSLQLVLLFVLFLPVPTSFFSLFPVEQCFGLASRNMYISLSLLPSHFLFYSLYISCQCDLFLTKRRAQLKHGLVTETKK